MAVNLSPYGGVGAQFLDNNGNVLTGGKIFTYAAGTTTPQATYTSTLGSIAHPNPIILDSAGRVPGGEIWLTDGLEYKFVLQTANNVLIATYDNVIGINSNFVNFTNEQEIQTATAGQTVFTLTTTQYSPGTNSLSVFVDGVNQYGPGAQYAYLETDSTTVTFLNGLHVGALVKFTTSQLNSNAGGTASGVSFTGFKGQVGNVQDLADTDGSDWIGFEAAGANAVAMSAQDKLRETVSVKDFGAVGDGVTDDSTAISNAVNYAHQNNSATYFPPGTYLVNTSVTVGTVDAGNIIIYGYRATLTTTNTTIQGVLNCQGPSPSNRGGRVMIRGLIFEGQNKTHANIGLKIEDIQGVHIEDCIIRFFGKGIYTYNVDIATIGNKNYVSFCTTGIECDGPSGGQANNFGIQGNLINQCDVGVEYRGGIGANICFNEIDNNGIHVRVGYGSNSYDAYGTTISYNKFESTETSMSATPTTVWLGGLAGVATSPLVEHNSVLAGDTEVTFRVANIQGNGRIKNNVVAPADPLFTYTLINQASSATKAVFSEADLMPNGTVTFTSADTSKAVTFAVAEPDTNYNVFLTVNGSAGTPASGSSTIVDVQKTISGFTAFVSAAPGVGNAVAYAWQLSR